MFKIKIGSVQERETSVMMPVFMYLTENDSFKSGDAIVGSDPVI